MFGSGWSHPTECVPDHPWLGNASPGTLPLVLTTQPSSQHTPTAGASLMGGEPKCSWEQGQVCVIKNKNSQQIAYFWVWVWDALSISSNSWWDCNYCSGTFQKQEQTDSLLSTTNLLAVTGVRKEKQQLWLCAGRSYEGLQLKSLQPPMTAQHEQCWGLSLA